MLYQLKNLFPEDVRAKANLIEETAEHWSATLAESIGESYKTNPYLYLDLYAKLYLHEFVKYTNELETLMGNDRRSFRVWNMYCITIDHIRKSIDIIIPTFDNDYNHSDAIDYAMQVHAVVSEIISTAVSQELKIDPTCLIKLGHKFIDTLDYIKGLDDEL